MPNWYDLVPNAVATKQIAWERNQMIRRTKERHGDKLSFKEIGKRFGIGHSRAFFIYYKMIREMNKPSPVEQYFRQLPLSDENGNAHSILVHQSTRLGNP